MSIRLIILGTLLGLIILDKAFTQNISDEIDVQGNYMPRLKPKEKFYDRPMMQDTFRITIKPEYDLEATVLETSFELDTIKSLRFKANPTATGNRFFIKAGFGNYLTPFAQLDFGNRRNKNHIYNVKYNYLAGAGRIGKFGYPGLSSHHAGAQWLFRNDQKNQFEAQLQYENSRTHYYGFLTDSFPTISRKDIRQRYNFLGLNLAFSNTHENDSDKIYWRPVLSYHFVTDRFGTAENSLAVNATLQKFLNRIQIGGKVSGGLFHNSAQNLKGTTSGWCMINPYLNLLFGKLHFKIGAAGYFTTDSLKTELYAVPDFALHTEIIGKYLLLDLRAQGGVYRNTLDRLRRENPFIYTNPIYDFTIHQLEASGGFRGSFSKSFSWTAKGIFDIFSNYAFYVNSLADTAHRIPDYAGFEVVYGNLVRTTLHGAVRFHQPDKIESGISADYYFFHQKNNFFPGNSVPYHPLFRITGRLNLQIIKNLRAGLDIFYIHTQTGFLQINSTTFDTVKIKGVTDINLNAEYNYNSMLGFWAGFHNLAAFAYNRWFRYPTQGFNFLAGFSLRF